VGARFQGKKCFILVDVEGAERDMLAGAKTLLASDPKPIWMVEIAVSEHQPQGVKITPNLLETFQCFWDNHYESWTADQRLRRVGTDEVKAIAETGADTLGTHNFLFMRAGQKAAIFGN
jgi:hypothetical protein